MTEADYRAALVLAQTGDIVRLRWRDSSRLDIGWDTAEAYRKALDEMTADLLEESAGFYVDSNEAFVLIAHSMQRRNGGKVWHVVGGMSIPHEAIRSFEILAFDAALVRGETRSARQNREPAESVTDLPPRPDPRGGRKPRLTASTPRPVTLPRGVFECKAPECGRMCSSLAGLRAHERASHPVTAQRAPQAAAPVDRVDFSARAARKAGETWQNGHELGAEA